MKYLFYFTLTVFLLSSCGINQDVTNGSWIQKRKYTKGYHLSKKSNKTKDNEKNSGHLEMLTDNKAKATDIKNNEQELVDIEVANKNISAKKEITHNEVEVIHTNIEKKNSSVIIASTNESQLENVETNGSNKLDFNMSKIKEDYYGSFGVEDENVDEDIKLIIAIILCLVALSPLGVYIMKGSGSDFTLNLLLWIIAVLLSILRAVVWTSFGLGYGLAGLVMLIAIVHGILVILDLL